MRLAIQEGGFTLIELLTIIAIIGILAALSISGFSLYKASAAYAVAETSIRNAQNAMAAATSDSDHPPAAVALTSQSAPGPIVGAGPSQLLPGMILSKNLKLEFGYDPTCIDATCPWESYLQANHCQGKEFVRWIRFGDGVEVRLENVAGAGCP